MYLWLSNLHQTYSHIVNHLSNLRIKHFAILWYRGKGKYSSCSGYIGLVVGVSIIFKE